MLAVRHNPFVPKGGALLKYDETVKYEKGEDGKLKKVGVKVEAEGLEKAKKQES